MEFIETMLVFIGLKIKETTFFIGKWAGIIVGVSIVSLLFLGAIGGISIGIWQFFSAASVDAHILIKIRDFHGVSYFWTFTITSIFMGFIEVAGIISGILIWVMGYQSFWITVGFFQGNWYKAREIVMKRRSI